MAKRLATKPLTQAYRIALTAVFCAFALSACQHNITAPTSKGGEGNWRSGQYDPYRGGSDFLPQWKYQAKVSVRSDALNEQANLNWTFSNATNEINIFGPFGVGATRLSFDQYTAELSNARGIIKQGQDAQMLLREIVGWPLPLFALSDWLFARPAEGHVYRYQLDQQGSLSRLLQSGWSIQFKDYSMYGQHLLPKKIFAQRNVAGIGLVEVRVVAKSWSL